MIDKHPPQEVIAEIEKQGYRINDFGGRQWVKTDWEDFDTAAYPLWMAFAEDRSVVLVFHCKGYWIIYVYPNEQGHERSYRLFNIDDIQELLEKHKEPDEGEEAYKEHTQPY